MFGMVRKILRKSCYTTARYNEFHKLQIKNLILYIPNIVAYMHGRQVQGQGRARLEVDYLAEEAAQRCQESCTSRSIVTSHSSAPLRSAAGRSSHN